MGGSLLCDYDVLVIGAGAAGIAAARNLQHTCFSVAVLEARDRIGGRAHTVRANVPAALDLGCEWLHSADLNSVVGVAQSLGMTIDTRRPDWRSHVGRHFPDDDRDAFQSAMDRFWARAEDAAATGVDRPASDLLEPGDRWNPLIQAISTYYNGTELETVSVIDLGRYEDTGLNWRVADGYGTFVERAATGLDVRTGCQVLTVDHSGPAIRVETSAGTLFTRAVVLTIPSAVLAAGAIRFRPDLPEKLGAAAHLPLGLADKLFFTTDDTFEAPEGHLFGTTDSAATISFDVRPRGRPLVEGFVGGAFARDLERGGPAAFEAAGRAQLAHMLGSDALKHLTFLRSTAWALDPLSQGSYSHALPGHSDDRAILATPVDGRLFFAGEACSRRFFSTAHGAWETGVVAARDIAAAFSPRRRAAVLS